jgi:hypothetical protein
MPPQWVNPQWQDDDLFVLSPPEVETAKRQVAGALGIRYKTLNADSPWSSTVAGINAFSLDNVTPYLKQYTELKGTKTPKSSQRGGGNFQQSPCHMGVRVVIEVIVVLRGQRSPVVVAKRRRRSMEQGLHLVLLAEVRRRGPNLGHGH